MGLEVQWKSSAGDLQYCNTNKDCLQSLGYICVTNIFRMTMCCRNLTTPVQTTLNSESENMERSLKLLVEHQIDDPACKRSYRFLVLSLLYSQQLKRWQ